MEPLSITTGILCLVGTAIKGARTTKSFIDGIRGAPQAVSALSQDLAALADVLETLQNFLNSIDKLRNPQQALDTGKLQKPLNSCVKAMNSIKKEVQPFIVRKAGSSCYTWKSMLFTFREKDFTVLQRTLGKSQTSLTNAVAIVILSSQTHGFERVQHHISRGFGFDNESIGNPTYAGSTFQGSDRGYAIRRFLLETETIAGYSPPLSSNSSSNDLVDSKSVEVVLTVDSVPQSLELPHRGDRVSSLVPTPSSIPSFEDFVSSKLGKDEISEGLKLPHRGYRVPPSSPTLLSTPSSEHSIGSKIEKDEIAEGSAPQLSEPPRRVPPPAPSPRRIAPSKPPHRANQDHHTRFPANPPPQSSEQPRRVSPPVASPRRLTPTKPPLHRDKDQYRIIPVSKLYSRPSRTGRPQIPAPSSISSSDDIVEVIDNSTPGIPELFKNSPHLSPPVPSRRHITPPKPPRPHDQDRHRIIPVSRPYSRPSRTRPQSQGNDSKKKSVWGHTKALFKKGVQRVILSEEMRTKPPHAPESTQYDSEYSSDYFTDEESSLSSASTHTRSSDESGHQIRSIRYLYGSKR